MTGSQQGTGAQQRALAAVGVTGSGRALISEAVEAGAGWAPLLLLAITSGLGLGQGAVLLLAPELGDVLQQHSHGTGAVLGWWYAAAALAVPLGYAAGQLVARTLALATGVAAQSLGLGLLAVSTGRAGVSLAAALAGAGAAVAVAARRPLLCDLYPPSSRQRVLGAYRGAAAATAAALVAVLVVVPALSSLTWRAGVAIAAVVAGAAAVAVVRLADPVAGGLDVEQARLVLRTKDAPGVGEPERMSMLLALRHVLPMPAARVLSGAHAVLALVGSTAVVYGGYALTQLHGVSRAGLAALLLLSGAAAAVGVPLVGSWADASLRSAPRTQPLLLAGLVAAGGGGLLALALLPTWGAAAGLVIAVVAVAAALALVDEGLAAIAPAEVRSMATLIGFGYALLPGLVLGGAITSGLDATYGLPVAITCVAAVALADALLVRRLAPAFERDLLRHGHLLVEREEQAESQRRGVRQPLLSCRHIDYAYGPVQVLFGVDLTVDEGEMVALLGTNGAGKSTLLRAISGLGSPSAGTVRYQGRDITHLDATDRVRLGITQIPGGKAVFGPLTVADNLRAYGYALGRDRRAVERGIEIGFETFPRLLERRDSLAATLSGGEQQMLALTKALMLEPRLLLIDELSLGLAPKVVGELLTIVRRINATGTAIVLVEQSVNVALELAQHAYFMEKGQVRFDGPTAELLERPDVLRSVFLQGAAAGLAG